MAFKKWTEQDPHTFTTMTPDLGIRNWDDVDGEQKKQIWQHLKNKGWFAADEVLSASIHKYNEAYRTLNVCTKVTEHGGRHYDNQYRSGIREARNCCFAPAVEDFHFIFHNLGQGVVYELMSFYINELEITHVYGYNDAEKRFANIFNELSNQYGLNIIVGEDSLVIKQDIKIVEDIYKPTLSYLGNKKWLPVSRDFGEANKAYLSGTPEDYSRCITLTISALQAFLQILVRGATGKGDIPDLIKEGQKAGIIPSDIFSTKILSDINSTLMKERQEKGDAHSKKEYADEKSARLTLNITMIFIQHCSDI